jgi:hypothetical protein
MEIPDFLFFNLIAIKRKKIKVKKKNYEICPKNLSEKTKNAGNPIGIFQRSFKIKLKGKNLTDFVDITVGNFEGQLSFLR